MSFAHTVGTLLTLSALASGSVGVTYAVKACEPLTTALLSYIALQASYSPLQMMSMLPIAAGLVVAASPALGVWSASLLHHSPQAATALTNAQDGPAAAMLLAGAVPALLSNIAFSARATLSKLKQQQLANAPSPQLSETAARGSRQPQRHLLAQFGYTLSPSVRVVGAPLPVMASARAPRRESPSTGGRSSLSLRAAAAAAAFGDEAMQRTATEHAWTPSGTRAAGGSATRHPFGDSGSESAEADSGGESGAYARHADPPKLPSLEAAVARPAAMAATRSRARASTPARGAVPLGVYELDNVDRLLVANLHALLFSLVLLAQDAPSLAALSSTAAGMGHLGSGVSQLGWGAILGEPLPEAGADGAQGGWMQAAGRQPAAVDAGSITAAEMHQGNAAGAVLNASLCHALFSLCSFLVLTHVTPAQHSIANVCKRLFMIGVAAVVMATAVTPAQIVGAGITTAGVVWFFVLPSPSTAEGSACALLPVQLASCIARCSAACAWGMQQWSTVLLLHAAVILAVFLQHGSVL